METNVKPMDVTEALLSLETEYEDCLVPQPKVVALSERPKIYVAGYFSANPMHGTANAAKWFQPLLDAGWLPIIPHSNILLDMLCPQTPEFWYSYDIAILRDCKAIFICPDVLTGESDGVSKEELYAKKNGITLFYGLADVLSPEQVGL